ARDHPRRRERAPPPANRAAPSQIVPARRARGWDPLSLSPEWRRRAGRGRGSPPQMIDKLDEVERRYDRPEAAPAKPGHLGDPARLTKVMKERSSLERIVSVYREFKSVRADQVEAERMLASSDADERALGKEELPALKERRDALEAELKVLLIPKDPNDEKN